MATYNAGIVTAYGAAVQGGYTGTYEQFCTMQAHFAENAAAAQDAAQRAEQAAATLTIDATLTHAGQAADAKKVGDEISTVKDGLTAETEAREAADEEINTALDHKAEIDGYYEDMTVGDAEQLVASQYVEDSVPYNFRTTGGSADAGNREYVDAVVGGTVVWNQLASSARQSTTVYGLTLERSADTLSVRVSGTATNSGNIGVLGSVISGKENHVYLLSIGTAGVEGAIINGYPFNKSGAVGVSAILGKLNSDNNMGINLAVTSGAEIDITVKPMCFDLTQMFGSTIADYIYSLEQATAGAGVPWLKKYFPKIFNSGYIPYNPGELVSVSGLQSHNTVGFNQWDEEWEVGAYNSTTGEKSTVSTNMRCKNAIPVCPNTAYYIKAPVAMYVFEYDANGNFLEYTTRLNGILTTKATTHFMRFYMLAAYGTTYNHDICINLSWSGWCNGEYEAYQKHSYPLDDSLTLRGIPKLDAQNNLYYDGDEYLPYGTVNRRYGVVDLGTLSWNSNTSGLFNALLSPYGVSSANGANVICSKYVGGNAYASSLVDKRIQVYGSSHNVWVRDADYSSSAEFKAAMSGVMLVYELAEPTTENAEPYQHIQVCDDFGTEEYVSTSIVPVGHNTRYSANLRDKLQHLPDLADDDGYYMIGQSNKQMHLELFRIPIAPTADGTYTLKATVSGGTPTYTWEAQNED